MPTGVHTHPACSQKNPTHPECFASVLLEMVVQLHVIIWNKVINGPSKIHTTSQLQLTIFTTVGDSKGRKSVKQSDKDLWLWGWKSFGL